MTQRKPSVIEEPARWRTYISGDKRARRYCPYCKKLNVVWILKGNEVTLASCGHLSHSTEWKLVFKRIGPGRKKGSKNAPKPTAPLFEGG